MWMMMIIIIINKVSAHSYNQPKFCPFPSWNPNAITFANNSTIGSSPSAIFVNSNNIIYVVDRTNDRIVIWTNDGVSLTRIMLGGLSLPCSIFVAINGDIYVDNGHSNSRVDKWTLNTNTSIPVMYVNSTCDGLFIDINDTLYCSMFWLHQVVKRWLNDNTTAVTPAVGTGTAGSHSNMLDSPRGIFVDINFDLYVADFGNNRIQLFRSGQLNGTTVAGDGSSSTTITLVNPTGIVLDADKYLFIVDQQTHRIVGSGPNGFLCLVGCSGSGSASNQLLYPTTLSFDSYGNMFVIDWGNARVQKFLLSTNLCDETTSTEVQTTVVGTTKLIRKEELTSTEQKVPTVITTTKTTVVGTTTLIQKEELISTEQKVSTVITTTKTSVINQTCYRPEIKLIPGTSSTSLSPIQFRRSQDFYILSIIKLNCNESISTITKWIIKNCTLNCSHVISLDTSIITTFSELYIPSNIFPYGIYELNLIVTMFDYPILTSSSSVYVRITPSGITANLVELGTSMITSGHQQELKLNPGNFSIDPDGYQLNASDWKYKYFCRIYGLYNIQAPFSISAINNLQNDSFDLSCLSNRSNNGARWKLDGVNLSPESSIRILPGSLQSNQTYQFLVIMENRRNASLQATGYVLVQIEDSNRPMIVIGCVISAICSPNLEYQLVNPTTQVALFSRCVEACTTIKNFKWNIYYGLRNSSSNFSTWILFDQMNTYEDIWFFGRNTSNFTATNKLFLNRPEIELWRFEVVYTFEKETSLSALNFKINPKPSNGTCSIDPSNGTTSTLFNITCSNWYKEDNIKDYSLYTWITDPSKLQIIALSPASTFQVRLPAGNNLNLMVHIRDILDCITEYNLSSISVLPDLTTILNLINNSNKSLNEIKNNPIIQLLSSGNQNTVGQAITSLSQELDKINNRTIDKALSNGISFTRIAVSSLGSQIFEKISTPMNTTALNEYLKELNSQANLREILINFLINLTITSANSIKLQSLSLIQLTQPTNQLTRTTLMLVSNKCYQLSVALHSMSKKIPYEDVQIAATQLMQSASNILTGVNGPLQQRTNVLDSDFLHATKIPEDYDTNLESEWSNLNLFITENDFLKETIDKNRNIYYQKQLANQIMNQVNQIRSLLTSALNIHLNIGQNLIMNTSEVFMSLETILIDSIFNRQIQQVGHAHIRIPKNFKLDQNQTVSLRSIMEPLASFGNGRYESHTSLSTLISLSILDQNGNEIPIKTNVNNSIEFLIPRDPNLIIPSMILQNVTSMNSTHHNQLFHLHYINITTILTISVHIEIRPLDANLSYLFIYKFDNLPQLNSSIYQIDGWTLFCPSNLSNDSIYTYFIDNQRTEGHQSVVFGLRELNTTEMINFCSNISINNPPIINERFNFTSDYELRIYTSGCYYLDQNNQWKSDGLLVGSLTNHYQTQCFSTHLTKFAGGWIILPDSIDLKFVFANADFMKNKTIYLTIISVSIIYIILIIYARFYDKKDIEKLGVTPLPDNHQNDQYFYQIIVFTGQRKDAGTKSKVHFLISGDDDTTSIRTFADPHRKILQRGGIDAFIMAVPKSLGLLNCIRIWHDNSGQGSSASWFLKYIIVRDLQTMDKFHFISQRWFAVEKDDGKIERVLPVAGEIEKGEFSYILSKQAYHSIADGHLWFSIFSRPPSNKFTRVQRCTCCFVLLFISMFLNIMYYDLSNQAKMNNSIKTVSLSFGPLYISSDEILIGIIIELFSLIPSILLVQFFRRIRCRHQRVSPLRQAFEKMKQPHKIKNNLNRNDNKQKSSITFPWWCLFVVYGLSLLLVGILIFFIIARGIEYRDLKAQKWLTSILSGLFSSIFLTQPLKIVCLAIFFAFFFRHSDDQKEANEYIDDNQINLNNDEEYLHSNEIHSLFTYRPPIRANCLNKAEVACARYHRLTEVRMWSIIRETFTYICFLSVLSGIIYSNCDLNSFHQVNHLRRYFLNQRQTNYDYTKILTINEYWKWLENSFVENLRAQQWYNRKTAGHLRGYINDKSNRLVGWAIMRQLRIKSKSCHYKKILQQCLDDYSLLNEEKRSFQPGWMNQTKEKYNSVIYRSFEYQSSEQLDTYVYIGDHGSYSGNGYVYEFRDHLSELRNHLSELHKLGWIDNKTRAVFIQLTLYNPNVQLLTSVTFLTEFLSTGGIYPQSRFEPFNFYAFTSIYQLICIIIYMIIILYFMWLEVLLLFELKWKYFCRFWSFIEVGIIVCSWTGVCIYIWRYKESKRISQLFEKKYEYFYINLQLSAYINSILTYLFGFCCFFGTIKFLRLCRFNRRLSLFNETLRYAGKKLISFLLMFSIIFFSFVCLFYLLFISKISSCSSFFYTMQMLFEITLFEFNAKELIDAASFLGPFCFSLFIILVGFICISMFITIINDNFRLARQKANDDPEIFSFMFKKFLRWTGLKKPTELEIAEERDARMRSEYLHSIDAFPQRIDQLLEVVNRICMSQRSRNQENTI